MRRRERARGTINSCPMRTFFPEPHARSTATALAIQIVGTPSPEKRAFVDTMCYKILG